ncbi:MAG: 4-alpha-glucanotransferase, partial [Bryobacteraceae bacterium]|nr:4-alpha-glucanotransferase [Bryobacteraceae bacterium]
MATPPITFVPSPSYEAALRRAAELWGIQLEFWDIFGHHHVASPETLSSVLRSLGVSSESAQSLNAAIESRLWSEWSSPVAQTLVVSLSAGAIPIQLKDSEAGAEIRFEWESGGHTAVSVESADSIHPDTARLRDHQLIRIQVPLPKEATLGYHRVTVSTAGGRRAEGRLILCPDQAWQPDFLRRGGRGAGVAISLYGLRSHRNWGCGDFTDLEHFTQWASETTGVAFVALNPLHAIPNRQPYNTSPYLPNCSFYRNGIYLDVERLDEFTQSEWANRLLRSAKVQNCLAELRAAPNVEYAKVWRLKLVFLKLAFREWLRRNPQGTGRREVFLRYIEGEGNLLHRFAVYQALDEAVHKRDRNLWIWPDWPTTLHDPDSPQVREFESTHATLILFFKYVQWRIDGQVSAAQDFAQGLGMPIGLYHDLALATDRCGSDLWAHPQAYVQGCRVGSPPDDFSPKGQDWAFPPPNSIWHRDSGYELFVQSIRKNS